MTKTTKNAIGKLGTMKVKELEAKLAEATGGTTRSPNKTFLIRRITEALQAAEADAKPAKAKEPEINAPADQRETDAAVDPARAQKSRARSANGWSRGSSTSS